MKYGTIVTDPPWPFEPATKLRWQEGTPKISRANSYPKMSMGEIAALPVAELALPDAHLYVWTVNRFLEETFGVVRGWGFAPATTLVWAKSPMGGMLGGTYASCTEFIIFARRGNAPAKRRMRRNWWTWARPRRQAGRGSYPVHSGKPQSFQWMVEEVSPGPYLEMFGRSHRPGWEMWGNSVFTLDEDVAATMGNH